MERVKFNQKWTGLKFGLIVRYVYVYAMAFTKHASASSIYAYLTLLPFRWRCNIFIREFSLLKLIWMHIRQQYC